MARRGNRNVKVLRMHENKVIGVRCELTRKTKIDGNIVYSVVVTNMNTGDHYRIFPCKGIMDAMNTYRAALA